MLKIALLTPIPHFFTFFFKTLYPHFILQIRSNPPIQSYNLCHYCMMSMLVLRILVNLWTTQTGTNYVLTFRPSCTKTHKPGKPAHSSLGSAVSVWCLHAWQPAAWEWESRAQINRPSGESVMIHADIMILSDNPIHTCDSILNLKI